MSYLCSHVLVFHMLYLFVSGIHKITVNVLCVHLLQADCDVIKIDIQCLVQGDVVLECVHLDLDPEREVMMFRVMFNTAFIRSNILILNSDNLDILWDSKERYPKRFRAEVTTFLSISLDFRWTKDRRICKISEVI